jgi:hypothetical protein
MLLMLLLTSCDREEHTVILPPPDPGPDSIDCPLPVELIDGYRTPQYASTHQTLSHDGRLLAYINGEASLHILDLVTLGARPINLQEMLPDSIRLISINNILWSPYDNNRIVISATTFADTIGNQRPSFYGQRLLMVSLNKGTAEDITPPLFSAVGAPAIALFAWLRTSSIGNDTLLIAYSNPDEKSEERFPERFYVIQTQKLTRHRFPPFAQGGTFVQHPNGEQYIGVVPSFSSQDRAFINNNNFYIPAQLVNKISWSPNGRKVALSVMPKRGEPRRKFEQIWIIDVDRYLRELPDTVTCDVINLQTRFCMYSFLGCNAEFITDSTLAVSMHADGGNSSLWEISTTGRRIRQLTFLP